MHQNRLNSAVLLKTALFRLISFYLIHVLFFWQNSTKNYVFYPRVWLKWAKAWYLMFTKLAAKGYILLWDTQYKGHQSAIPFPLFDGYLNNFCKRNLRWFQLGQNQYIFSCGWGCPCVALTFCWPLLNLALTLLWHCLDSSLTLHWPCFDLVLMLLWSCLDLTLTLSLSCLD